MWVLKKIFIFFAGFGISWCDEILLSRQSSWKLCNKMYPCLKYCHNSRCDRDSCREVPARHAHAVIPEILALWGACQWRLVLICPLSCIRATFLPTFSQNTSKFCSLLLSCITEFDFFCCFMYVTTNCYTRKWYFRM